jgi:four helix bundle protein
MKVTSFEDLIVWQKSHQLTLEIYRLTKSYPQDERFGLISQIRRSAVSVCANIAEGQTKTRRDFSRFFEIARGSLEETKYHLILSRDLSYCSQPQFENLFKLSDEIGRMIYGLNQKLRHL